MPMPGPMHPEGGESGADVLHVLTSSYCPAVTTGVVGTVGDRRRSMGGLELLPLALDVAERLLGDVPLLLVMALDGEDDEHERQDAEDERLDRVEHELQRRPGRPG